MIEATVTPLVIQEKKSGVTSYYTCAGKGKGGAYVLTASRLCGPLRLTGPWSCGWLLLFTPGRKTSATSQGSPGTHSSTRLRGSRNVGASGLATLTAQFGVIHCHVFEGRTRWRSRCWLKQFNLRHRTLLRRRQRPDHFPPSRWEVLLSALQHQRHVTDHLNPQWFRPGRVCAKFENKILSSQ